MNILFRSVNKARNDGAVYDNFPAPDWENSWIAGVVKLTATLKENCSIKTPTFKLQLPVGFTASDLTGKNYCYSPELGRYYFINEWRYVPPCWECDCETDVLSSFRNAICSTRQYITRTTLFENSYIRDNTYPVAGCSYKIHEFASPWIGNFKDGLYILGLVSHDVESIGAVTYYAMNKSTMAAFLNKLMGGVDWFNISDISQELSKVLINPLRYVHSCAYIPMTESTILNKIEYDIVSAVKYGYWSFAFNCYKIKQADYTVEFSREFTYTTHPQVAERGQYLKQNPFSSYKLFLTGVGNIVLDSAKMSRCSQLFCDFRVDLTTGKTIVDIRGKLSDPMATNPQLLIDRVVAQIGVDVSLADIKLGTMGLIASGISAVATPLLDSILPGKIMNEISGIGNAITASDATVSTSGSTGSLAGLDDNIRLECAFLELAPQAPNFFGKPLCMEYSLADCKGHYVQCANVRIGIDGATFEEIDAVKSYLEGGCWL